MEEYRIDIKIRNNLILSKIESLGYKSPLDFCKNIGISYGGLIAAANMKRPIFDKKGKIRPFINKLCDVLKCAPEEIFSANQMEASLATNKKTLLVNEAEAIYIMNQTDSQKMLEEQVFDDQRNDAILTILSTLAPRERQIIEMRMGLGEYNKEHTLKECGKKFNVNKERIRQIEQKALRKMRHPWRSDPLREYIYEE